VNDRRNNGVAKRKIYRDTDISEGWKGDRIYTRIFKSIIFGPSSSTRKYTLLILLLFGLVGILCDLDHLIIEQTRMVRPLHIPYFVGFWIIGVCYLSFLYRRFHKSCVNIKKIQKVK